MTQISSRLTWVYKWFATVFGALLVAMMAGVQLFDSPPNPTIALVVVILGGLALWPLMHVSRKLADRVDDFGDHLLVRKGGQEVRIPLSDIASLPGAPLAPHSPRRLRVRLRVACVLGDQIEFMVPSGAESGVEPVSESLVRRLACLGNKSRS